MKEKGGIIEWSMQHKVVALAMTAVLFLLGIYALLNMSRNEFPDFTIRQGLIIGIYPGASSTQVEDQLTKKTEEYLFSFNEVNKAKTYSYSRDGMMYIFVEVADHVSGSDTKAFWNKIKNGLLLVQAQMPKEFRGYMVNSDFGSTSAMLLSVESPTRPYKDLQRNVEVIEDALRQVKNVARISRTGNLNEQIGVYVDNNKLLQYGISAGQIMQVLQQQGAVGAAGSEDGTVVDRPIHLTSFFRNESDLAEQVISSGANGSLVRLRDVAELKREYEKPDAYITANGTKSIVISLEMIPGKNIVHFGEALDERLDKVLQTLPKDIKVTKLANQPKVVEESIAHFMTEFGSALVGVVVIALLLLPFTVASVAAATIPITIAATLALMYMFGIELDTVTLAALIVVLGIVVDDPIVVIDNHIEKLDHGLSVWDAARSSAKELFPSVFTATLAISATFFPLMFFMEGVAADFISVFPTTIILALSLSLIVSMLVVPYFNTIFIKKGLHQAEAKKEKKSFLDYLQNFFNRHIGNAMAHYKLTTLFGVLAVLIGIGLMGLLPQQLFPKVERNQLAMEIYLPSGYSLEQTDSVVKALERIMAEDERIVNYTSFIGTSSPRFHTVYAPNLPAKNYAQVLINTTSEDATEVILGEYQQKYGNLFPSAFVRMKQLNMINAAAPVEVRISGNDMASLYAVGKQVMAIGKKHPQVTWARTDYEQMQSSIKLNVDHQEASRLGLGMPDISHTIGMNMEGITATQIWEGNYPLDVKIKTPESARNNTNALLELNIPSQQTRSVVPLRQIAAMEPEWHPGTIVRRNGIRTLTVRMDVVKEAVANNVLADMQPAIEALKLPEGLSLAYGGELELQNENMGPMGLSLLASIILIFLILIWHFQHLKHAILSITTMPLSILGATLGLLITGYPFGFTSFLGLLALCGIVVRNGIILIDHAEELRLHEGKTVKEAGRLSAERRMRPIFLTSSAAAVGVIPMIISGSSLWGPLGTVICFGLMVSMLLTLFVLPTLYWLFFRKLDQQGATPTV